MGTQNPETIEYLAFSPYFVDSKNVDVAAEKKIQERLSNLPEPFVALLMDPRIIEFLRVQSKTYGLATQQVLSLSRAVRDVVIGMIPSGGLTMEIQNRISISGDIANAIARSMTELIKSLSGGEGRKQTPNDPGEINQNSNSTNTIDLRNQN